MKSSLTHLDQNGEARMVNVSEKSVTQREAVAVGKIRMGPAVIDLVRKRNMSKGDVLSTARLAGIQAAKRTDELIPLCHSLALDLIEVSFDVRHDCIQIQATVRSTGKTGVEMEALTAVSVAALTVYDMCKSIDKTMTIGPIFLMKKTGGKSGDFVREGI